jgi:amino acid permease
MLYLKTKDLIPDQPESLFEIGYMVMGRKAIFIIAGIQMVNALGLMMIYFVVFGDTSSQLIEALTGHSGEFYCEKWFYVCLIAGLLMPLILQKDLSELKVISYVLFVSLFLFVFMNLAELLFDGRFVKESPGKHFWIPTFNVELIQSLSITLVAYSYQQNVFPIFSSLKNKTNEEYRKVGWYGLLTTFCIYIAVAVISILMFGKYIESSVLDNIGLEYVNNIEEGATNKFFEAYVVQISFMIVIACHIPFIFFSGKEGLCILIDELDRKSISNALWHKLQGNADFARRTVTEEPPNPELPVPGGDEGMAFNAVLEDEMRLSTNA